MWLGRVSSKLFCCAWLVPALLGQPVIPLLDCVEPLSTTSGATQLLNAVAAGVSNTEARFAASVPPGARITLNPGGANQEVFLNPSSTSASTFFRTFSSAHAAGEPVQWEHIVSVAHFGYQNAGTNAVNLVAGSSSNFFSPGNPNVGQPSTFLPGKFSRVVSAATIGFRDLVWIIDTQIAVARSEAASFCPDLSSIPVIAGRTLTLTAGSTSAALTLANAGLARDPSAPLTLQVQSLWIANAQTVAFPATGAQISVANLLFQNGAISADVTVGPTAPARYAILLKATGPSGVAGYGTAFVDVRSNCALNVSPASLPQATQGVPYSPVTFSATGGSAPYAFSLDANALPPGITFNAGVLSGTPTLAGAYPFSLVVTDAASCMTQTGYTLTVAGPSCASNVTQQVQVSLSGIRRNLVTGRWLQTVTLRNGGTSALAGPIALVFDNLSANATLFNPSGTTACAAPLGRAYVLVPAGTDQILSPGETATANLEFVNAQASTAITYTPRILAGGTQR